MQNHRAVEAVYSATYVEDFLDAIDNLPDEIARQITLTREKDIESQKYVTEVTALIPQYLDLLERNVPAEQEQIDTLYKRIQLILMNVQAIGDDKIKIVQKIQDYAENRTRQLELDRKTLEHSNRSEHSVQETNSGSSSLVAAREMSAKTNDQVGESRGLKRARRARLGPSILGSSAAKSSPSTQGRAVEERRPEVCSATHSVSSSTVSSTSVQGTPNVTPAQPPASAAPAATKPARAPAASTTSSAPGRRENEVSTSSTAASAPIQKRATTESVSSAPSTSETVERKSESTTTTRTPKKTQQQQEKKQKLEKKQAAATATKKRKSRQVDDSPPMNLQADPDEPTYCLCDQISYGDMIGCDNDLCPIEWFHFSCVSLSIKPKGKWYCPKCRGDRPNIMKPKAIFLKELEKYNREKEEKA